MEIKEEQVTLRKMIAGKGKVIISKEVNEENIPVLISKEIYLGKNASPDEFEEVDEKDYKENNE